MNKDRNIDDCGEISFSIEGLIDSFYTGNFSNKMKLNNAEAVSEFNKNLKFRSLKKEYDNNKLELYSNNLSILEYDKIHNKWNIPEKYLNMDIKNYILQMSNNDLEYDRLSFELEIYESRGFFDLLRAMVYLFDIIKENNIVYGVGRGSSVASYVLYKIGIHRIDSLKYDIDFSEFLD